MQLGIIVFIMFPVSDKLQNIFMLFIFYCVQPLIGLFEGSLFKIYDFQSKVYKNRLHVLLCLPATLLSVQLGLLVSESVCLPLPSFVAS